MRSGAYWHMASATETFAALADPIRLRCLALIAARKELCVCELVAALELPQPKVSRHLAILKTAGLLLDRRDAQWVLYSIASDMPDWANSAIDAAIKAMAADRQHAKDIKRLSRTLRPPLARRATAA
jgi:ArsR family transcriptional regulator, arsenate/arsenite/antimonite-responsive transcriptional repressor